MMIMARTTGPVFGLILAGLLAVVGSNAVAQGVEPLADGIGEEATGPYLLQPSDVIDVQVLEDPSLNRQLLIQPDGLVSFPLAGAVQAGGKTPGQLANDIRRALSDDFLEPPAVTVALVSIGAIDETVAEETLVIYVFGEVNNPGRFEVTDPVNVMQALAIAGGPGIFAATRRIQVRKRDEEGVEQLSFFNFDAVNDGNALPFPAEIDDGDVVFVPERGLFE